MVMVRSRVGRQLTRAFEQALMGCHRIGWQSDIRRQDVSDGSYLATLHDLSTLSQPRVGVSGSSATSCELSLVCLFYNTSVSCEECSYNHLPSFPSSLHCSHSHSRCHCLAGVPHANFSSRGWGGWENI